MVQLQDQSHVIISNRRLGYTYISVGRVVLVIGLQPTKTRAELVVRLVDGLIFETNIL